MDTIKFPDRYEIISRIGSGAMGTVYKARDKILDKDVAIKTLLNSQSWENPHLVQRFQLEAKAAGKLKQDNLVTVLDFGVTEENVPYLVMDLIQGPTLKEYLADDNNFSESRLIEIIMEVVEGMNHAHKNGVIHRDLKTSNIIITTNSIGKERAKVIDFGIARVTSDNGNLTEINAILGSPLYMSPEQIGGKAVDERSDIYSLGCIIYECFAGDPPFVGETAIETMNMHSQSMPPDLVQAASDDSFYNGLNSIFQKCLAKDPDDRYQSMNELIPPLKRLAQELKGEEDEEEDDDDDKSNHSQKSPLSYLLIAISFGILGITGSILYFTGNIISPEESKPQSTENNKVEESSLSPPLNLLLSEISNAQIQDEIMRSRQNRLNLKTKILTRSNLQTIADSNITDASFRQCTFKNTESLSLLKKLKVITLTDTNLDDIGLKAISTCPDLTSIEAGSTEIKDKGLKELSKLTKLEEIELDHTDITDLGLTYLSRIPSLEKVKLGKTQITDEGLKEIVKLPKLTHLELDTNRITDLGLGYLTEAASLKHISLDRCSVTNKGIEQLAGIKTLKTIELRDCQKIDRKPLYKFNEERKSKLTFVLN